MLAQNKLSYFISLNNTFWGSVLFPNHLYVFIAMRKALSWQLRWMFLPYGCSVWRGTPSVYWVLQGRGLWQICASADWHCRCLYGLCCPLYGSGFHTGPVVASPQTTQTESQLVWFVCLAATVLANDYSPATWTYPPYCKTCRNFHSTALNANRVCCNCLWDDLLYQVFFAGGLAEFCWLH